MDFFDKVGKKISQTSQDVAQKTKNMAEIMRLNNMISTEERNINNAFHRIGKLYFETYGENPDQLFGQLIEEVNGSKTKIDSYSEQVTLIKGSGTAHTTSEPEETPENKASCNECDLTMTSETVFCSTCGSKIEQEIVEKQSTNPDSIKCPSCGQKSPVSASFCAGCGQKIKE